MKDYYKILRISRDASLSEIKKAYRKLALEYHPDRNHDPIAIHFFRESTEAYEILIDLKKRATYDDMFFKNSAIEKNDTIYEWQEQAQKKAEQYSTMDYDSFKKTLIQELKLVVEYVPGFGCLLFVICGVIVGIWIIIKGMIDGKDEFLGVGFIVFICYLIAFLFVYPRITKAYKQDREKISK